MIPGQQSAIVAHWNSHMAHGAANHEAIRSSSHITRNAALLDLADRLVGEMSDALARRLGLSISTRQVLISAETQRHTIERRAVASQYDSELVASRIAEAFSTIRYHLVPQRDSRVFELLGYVSSVERWLLLALKVMPAENELWIRTAHPFGKKNFLRAERKGFLVDHKK